MRTVAAVFTAQSIVESVKQMFTELVPDCRVVSIIEDALIQDVIREGRVTPEIALRLSVALGSSAESWLGHQAAYDLWELEQHLRQSSASCPAHSCQVPGTRSRAGDSDRRHPGGFAQAQ